MSALTAANKKYFVKYVFAITYSEQKKLNEVLQDIKKKIGDVDICSEAFVFNHTTYYQREMGKRLEKQFFSFERLHPLDFLVEMKLFFIQLEKKYSIRGSRVVNLDPAYMELAKLVVATTKNFDHRVFIGQNIFGDVQLRYRNNKFVSNDWTYPDYKSERVLNFFYRVRQKYYSQLKAQK